MVRHKVLLVETFRNNQLKVSTISDRGAIVKNEIPTAKTFNKNFAKINLKNNFLKFLSDLWLLLLDS